MKQLKERIHNMIHSMATPGPLFLVFHDNSQDIKYLRSPEIDAPLDGLSFVLPESCTEAETSDTPKIYVVDTSELFAALEGDSGGQKRSLERVCRLLQIKPTLTQHLHNAGNDARVMIIPPPPDTWCTKGKKYDSVPTWPSKNWLVGIRSTCNGLHVGHNTQAVTLACVSSSPMKMRTAIGFRLTMMTTIFSLPDRMTLRRVGCARAGPSASPD